MFSTAGIFSQGGAPPFPLSLGPYTWYKADSGIVSSSGNVTTWEDQSGNEYHLTGSIGFAPNYELTGSLYEAEAVNFTGSLDDVHKIGFSPINVSEEITIAARIQLPENGITGIVYSDDRLVNNALVSAGTFLYKDGSNILNFYTKGTLILTSSLADEKRWHTIIVRSQLSASVYNWDMRVDGIEVSSNVGVSAQSYIARDFQLCKLGSNASTGEQLQEFLSFDKSLSTSDIELLETYLETGTNPLIAMSWDMFLEAENFYIDGTLAIWPDSSGNNNSASRHNAVVLATSSSLLNIPTAVKFAANRSLFCGGSVDGVQTGSFNTNDDFTMFAVAQPNPGGANYGAPMSYAVGPNQVILNYKDDGGVGCYVYAYPSGLFSGTPTNPQGTMILRGSVSASMGLATHCVINGDVMASHASTSPRQLPLNQLNMNGGNRQGIYYAIGFVDRWISDDEVNKIGRYYQGVTNQLWTEL